jgi:hypothetical protein
MGAACESCPVGVIVWSERNHLEPAEGGRGWVSYGKQPRQRQCKEARFAPEKDRASRARQGERDEEGEEVASFVSRTVTVPSVASRLDAEFGVARTRYQVIIDHAGCLHQRVADRGAHKLEASL